MSGSTKNVRNLGVFEIILSIVFLIITIACIGAIISLHMAIKKIDSFVIIFIIILAVVIYFILGLIAFISLLLFIFNLATGITVVKNSSSYDVLYKKRGRIKFSIFILGLTAFVLIVAGGISIISLFNNFEVGILLAGIGCLVLGVLSIILDKRASKEFREIINVKSIEDLN